MMKMLLGNTVVEVDIYRAGTPRRLWFMSFEYGKDYMAAVRFVQQLNQEGR